MSKIIKFEEGFRKGAYYCSEGYPTIGYGTKLGPKNSPLALYTFTVSQGSAECMLEDYLIEIERYLNETFKGHNIEQCRWDVLESMCYQLGISGFKGFRKAIAAIHSQDWDTAAEEALDSLWAKQTPERAERHARVLREGNYDAYKGVL